MKKKSAIFTILLSTLLAICLTGCTPDDAEYVAGAGMGYLGHSIVTAPNGNLYLSATRGRELFVQKYSNGTLQWEEFIAHRGVDPTLGLDSNGDLHITYVDRDTRRFIYAKRVNGEWEKAPVHYVARPEDDRNFLNHKNLIIDGFGNPHIVTSVYGEGRILYGTSNNGIWQVESVPLNQPIQHVNAVDFTVDALGDPHIFYRYGHASSISNLSHVRKTGGSWISETLHQSMESDWGILYVGIDPNDVLYAITMSDFGQNNYLPVLYSKPVGSPWIQEIMPYPDSCNNLIVDDSGDLHFTYYDSDRQHYATRTGGTWNSGIPIADMHLSFIRLAVDENLKAHISSVSSDVSGLFYHTNLDGIWQSRLIENSEKIGGAKLVFDSGGTAHAVFYKSKPYSAYYGTKTGGSWQIVPFSDLGISDAGKRLELAIDSQDNLHIVYETGDETQFKYMTNESGVWASMNTLFTDDGSVPNLSVDSADNVHIVDLRLRVTPPSEIVHLHDSSGSWEYEIADLYEYGGRSFNFATDEDGYIYIMNNGSLRSSIILTTNRGGSWSEEIIPYDHHGPNPPDIAVDNVGNVHIAYIDSNDSAMLLTNSTGNWTQTSLPIPPWVDQSNYPKINLDSSGAIYVINHEHSSNGIYWTIKVYTDKYGPMQGFVADRYGGGTKDPAFDPYGGLHMIFRSDGAIYYKQLL